MKTKSVKFKKKFYNTAKFHKFNNNVRKFFRYNNKKFYFIFGLIFVIITALIFIKETFLSSQYNIKHITYAKHSVAEYDDPYMYKDIKTSMLNQNYFYMKFAGIYTLKDELKAKYGLIEDIDINKEPDNGISIDINFKKPKIIFFDGKRTLGSLDESFFVLMSGSALLSGKDIIRIPDFISSLDSFEGFYYQVPESKLFVQINDIKGFIGADKISNIGYLPGASRTIIYLNDGKELYFSNLKNIGDQLKKYYILSKNFADFDKLSSIDLGSNDDTIVKYKKEFIKDLN